MATGHSAVQYMSSGSLCNGCVKHKFNDLKSLYTKKKDLNKDRFSAFISYYLYFIFYDIINYYCH